MKKVFLTFGSHNDEYRPNIYYANITANKIKEFNIFDEINVYTADDLIKDTSFWKQHSNFIINNRRGFGYWIWKPYLIKKKMEELNDGDIILYLDSRIIIKPDEKQYLLQYIDIVKEKKILYSDIHKTSEFMYNKMDLIYKLNMQNNDLISSTYQCEANIQLIYVCKETRELINTIYNYACVYYNIDDTPSIIPNHPIFKDHRHDQSLFSLLIKKNNLYSNVTIDKCLYHWAAPLIKH
jgi:hypothetical protein